MQIKIVVGDRRQTQIQRNVEEKTKIIAVGWDYYKHTAQVSANTEGMMTMVALVKGGQYTHKRTQIMRTDRQTDRRTQSVPLHC